MKEQEIKRTAKKFIKILKGKVDFVSVEEYLKTVGYKVIFFNTPAGDKEIERFNLQEDARTTEAFTYNGAAKLVFINNDCSSEEKLYLLYHEAGHIILKHIDYARLSACNKVLLDIEADVFAYSIIHPPKPNRTLIFLWVLVAVLFVANFIPTPMQHELPSVENAVTEARPSGELSPKETERAYVLITPTGEKYHQETCRYVKGKSCTKLSEAEAQKNYDPCSVCNP